MIGLLTALAVLPVSAADVQLRGLEAGPYGRFGSTDGTLANVGDVNGDGVADVAVAAPSTDGRGRRDAGAVHVVFGGSALGKVDVGKAAGLHILGPRQGKHRPVPMFASDGAPKGAMAGTSV